MTKTVKINSNVQTQAPVKADPASAGFAAKGLIYNKV